MNDSLTYLLEGMIEKTYAELVSELDERGDYHVAALHAARLADQLRLRAEAADYADE